MKTSKSMIFISATLTAFSMNAYSVAPSAPAPRISVPMPRMSAPAIAPKVSTPAPAIAPKVSTPAPAIAPKVFSSASKESTSAKITPSVTPAPTSWWWFWVPHFIDSDCDTNEESDCKAK